MGTVRSLRDYQREVSEAGKVLESSASGDWFVRVEEAQVPTNDLPDCCQRAVHASFEPPLTPFIECLSCGAGWHATAPGCWVAHPDMEEILRGE